MKNELLATELDKTRHAPSHECGMPEHGMEHAGAACCRPARLMAGGSASADLNWRKPRFWRDGAVWKTASRNTLNCLIGCSIGDFGTIIYMQIYHPHVPMLLTMALAMTMGLITSILFESMILRFKEGFGWKNAVTTAFSMSFLSMLGMEFAANFTDYVLTGGGHVGVHQPFYWVALGISLVAGFLAPLPYNYWKFKKHGRACH